MLRFLSREWLLFVFERGETKGTKWTVQNNVASGLDCFPSLLRGAGWATFWANRIKRKVTRKKVRLQSGPMAIKEYNVTGLTHRAPSYAWNCNFITPSKSMWWSIQIAEIGPIRRESHGKPPKIPVYFYVY